MRTKCNICLLFVPNFSSGKFGKGIRDGSHWLTMSFNKTQIRKCRPRAALSFEQRFKINFVACGAAVHTCGRSPSIPSKTPSFRAWRGTPFLCHLLMRAQARRVLLGAAFGGVTRRADIKWRRLMRGRACSSAWAAQPPFVPPVAAGGLRPRFASIQTKSPKWQLYHLFINQTRCNT